MSDNEKVPVAEKVSDAVIEIVSVAVNVGVCECDRDSERLSV